MKKRTLKDVVMTNISTSKIGNSSSKRRKGQGEQFPLQKSVTLYKVNGKVTVRRPGAKESYVQYVVEQTSGTTLTKMKQFVKYIINDIKELNFLKNDMGFLMSEIYGKEHSTDTNIDVNHGKIFYFWVYLPLDDVKNSNSTSSSVQRDVFPFDIFYIRQKLSEVDCKSIDRKSVV